MKVNKFFIAALAASMMFASCSKEQSLVDLESAGKPAKISINLKGAVAKSVDDATIDEDAVINDLIVFVVKSDGVAFDIAPAYFAGSALTSNAVPQITATTNANKIYIVCNTGDFSTGPFKDVVNMNDVKAAALQLDGNPNTGSNCVSGNVWMSAYSVLTDEPAPAPDGTARKTATAQLKYVPAKVYVIVNNQMTNYGATANTLLDGIAIVNGGTWTRFVASSIESNLASVDFTPTRAQMPAGAPFFYNGIDVASPYADYPGTSDYVVKPVYKYTDTDGDFVTMNNFVSTTLAAPYGKVVKMGATDGFYVFPSITTNKTWATVYGRFAAGGAEAAGPGAEARYWSLCFGGEDGIATDITSGNKYVVTITLKGNATTGGGGTTDPTDEIVNAYVDITVEPALWVPELVEKTIN